MELKGKQNKDFNNSPIREQRWRAIWGQTYFHIKLISIEPTEKMIDVGEAIEKCSKFDDINFDYYNYFKTKEVAQYIADEMNKYIEHLNKFGLNLNDRPNRYFYSLIGRMDIWAKILSEQPE